MSHSLLNPAFCLGGLAVSPGAGEQASPVGQHQEPTGGSGGTGFDPYLVLSLLMTRDLGQVGRGCPATFFFFSFVTEFCST